MSHNASTYHPATKCKHPLRTRSSRSLGTTLVELAVVLTLLP